MCRQLTYGPDRHRLGPLGQATELEILDHPLAQSKDQGGRIQGAFRVLNPGKGCYAEGIRALLQQQLAFQNTADFLRRLQQMPGCETATHILNANALRRADEAEAASARERGSV